MSTGYVPSAEVSVRSITVDDSEEVDGTQMSSRDQPNAPLTVPEAVTAAPVGVRRTSVPCARTNVSSSRRDLKQAGLVLSMSEPYAARNPETTLRVPCGCVPAERHASSPGKGLDQKNSS
jgi:hypothetical protein